MPLIRCNETKSSATPAMVTNHASPIESIGQKAFGTFLQIGQAYGKTGKFDDELAGTVCSERTARMKGDLTGLMRSSPSIPLRSQQVGY